MGYRLEPSDVNLVSDGRPMSRVQISNLPSSSISSATRSPEGERLGAPYCFDGLGTETSAPPRVTHTRRRFSLRGRYTRTPASADHAGCPGHTSSNSITAGPEVVSVSRFSVV